MSLKHMKMVLNSKGNTVRLSKIVDGQRLEAYEFERDPSYRPNFVFWEFGVKEEDLSPVPIKTFNGRYSAANGETVRFNDLYDKPIVVGDVLYDKDSDRYWICTEAFNRDDIHGAGKLTRCNYWLKWQNENGKIFNYPIFEINSTQYNSGIIEDKTMVLGSSQHLIIITADENTIPLDHDKRFFFDRNTKHPTVYKLTQNDTTASYYDKGYLRITVMEDEYNPETDSIENWLCDYIPVIEQDIEISYVGNPTIRQGGNYKSFTALTENAVIWDISLSADQTDFVSTIIDGNKCKIKCIANEKIIGSSFELKCSDGDNQTIMTITILGGVK